MENYLSVLNEKQLEAVTTSSQYVRIIAGAGSGKTRVLTTRIVYIIKEWGIDEKKFLDQLDAMSEQAFDDQCTGANPRYPLISEIKQMYLNAYYGKNSETV